MKHFPSGRAATRAHKLALGVATLAMAGAACAQSSVTLFGIVDTDLSRGTGNVSSKTQVNNSGSNSSRIGFRGTEDLGGGMSASFWLEAGINTDNGTGTATNANNQAAPAAAAAGQQGLTFNRRSTVSVAGAWGELRLGRDYTPQFWSLTVFDPFGTNGAGTGQNVSSSITGVTGIRASNTISYLLPGNLGGFYGWLQHYRGENSSNAANAQDGNGTGVRVGYASGPFNVALALSRTRYLAGDVRQNNLAGSWDFKVAKAMAQYSWDRNGGLAGGSSAKGYLLGVVVPVGVGEIRAAHSRYRTDQVVRGSLDHPETKKYVIGYGHNLSKRTQLYATFARITSSGFAPGTASPALNGATGTGGAGSSGYDIGVRHSF
jgi:predicted porin